MNAERITYLIAEDGNERIVSLMEIKRGDRFRLVSATSDPDPYVDPKQVFVASADAYSKDGMPTVAVEWPPTAVSRTVDATIEYDRPAEFRLIDDLDE